MVQRRYVPALDGVRAIAVAGPFALHLDRAHFPGGAFGVDVFFVLSGYLITSILLGEFRERQSIAFGAFYWRRVIRLAPALVLWLAVIATPTAILAHAGQSIGWSVGSVGTYSADFVEGIQEALSTCM